MVSELIIVINILFPPSHLVITYGSYAAEAEMQNVMQRILQYIFGITFSSNIWSRLDSTFIICSTGIAECDIIFIITLISKIKS